MNIATSHTNSGFRSKQVQVTYAKLREVKENLGQVPVTDVYYQDWVPDGQTFVASTREKPVAYPHHPSRDVLLKNPVLDTAGKPMVEAVTETIEISGPKREALSWTGSLLGSTLMMGGAMSLPLGAAGAVTGAFLGSAGTGFKVGLMAGAALTALVTAPVLFGGLKVAKDMYFSTNTLSMDSTPIVKKEMQGYDATTQFLSKYGDPYIEFEPVLKETQLGVWDKPTIHSSRT